MYKLRGAVATFYSDYFDDIGWIRGDFLHTSGVDESSATTSLLFHSYLWYWVVKLGTRGG